MILVFFSVWEEARVWAYWNYSFDIHLNYLGPISCFPGADFLISLGAPWDGGRGLLWEGNRQEGQGSPNAGNRLQVSIKILCCYNTWFLLNLTFLKPWAYQCVFLMEMFSLSYVNEIMYLLWNFPFCKMVPRKTSSWLVVAQQTSVHIHCFMAGGCHTLCHPISKLHVVGEGPGETLSALRCISYLTNNFITDITSGSWWWTGRPGVLRSMGSQRVGHDWATELMRQT